VLLIKVILRLQLVLTMEENEFPDMKACTFPSRYSWVFGLVLFAFTSNAYSDWSDHALSLRYGETFREPFNKHNISKSIYSYTLASGSASGTNYLNVDWLLSDENDPIRKNSREGAEELYLLYRHTFDLGYLLDQELQFGPVRSMGVTAGVDLNYRQDAGYNSRKQMLVLGPTLMMKVPGFLNVSLLALWESNNPHASRGAFDPGYPDQRYHYDLHPMLNLAWGIPFASSPISFEGYANFITSKGEDETGHTTAPETNIDMRLMYNLSDVIQSSTYKVKIGVEYQYWRNKFGNSDAKVGSLGGNVASIPMVRLEIHF